MSITTALYEGDGLIHFAPRARATVSTRGRTPGHGRTTLGVTQVPLRRGKRRARRSATVVLIGAIWNAIRSVGLWLEENSRDFHQRRVESYLAQSSNHADLERRMRELEHNDRLNWIDCGSR